MATNYDALSVEFKDLLVSTSNIDVTKKSALPNNIIACNPNSFQRFLELKGLTDTVGNRRLYVGWLIVESLKRQFTIGSKMLKDQANQQDSMD